MDYSRHCYTTKMRLWADDAREVEIRWFRADRKARVFPGVSRFGSKRTWERQKIDWGQIGELKGGGAAYSKGQNPLGYAGLHFCGPQEAARAGGNFSTGPRIVTEEDGFADCCDRAFLGLGGVAMGGQADQTSPGPYLATGGLVASGEADQLGDVQSATGGLVVSGEAEEPVSDGQTATGGLVASGEAGSGPPPKTTSVIGWGGSESVGSISLSPPSGYAVGDVIVFAVLVKGSPPTDPTITGGFTLSLSGPVDADRRCWLGWKLATGSEPANYTATAGGSDYVLGVVVALRCPPGTLDGETNNRGTGTTLSTAGALASVDGEQQVGVLWTDTPGAYSYGGSFSYYTSYNGFSGAVYVALANCNAAATSPGFDATGTGSFTGAIALLNFDP